MKVQVPSTHKARLKKRLREKSFKAQIEVKDRRRFKVLFLEEVIHLQERMPSEDHQGNSFQLGTLINFMGIGFMY